MRTYAEHLEAWEELDRLCYDGVGFNEHHCSPYGLMNSPNLMGVAAPYPLYFNRTLFSHGGFTETAAQRKVGYVSATSTDCVRPENQPTCS